MDLKFNKTKFKKDGKTYTLLVSIFLVFAYIFFYTGNIYYTRISKTLSDTKEIQRDVDTLNAKVSSLRSIGSDTTSNVNNLNVAFQPDDPSLFMLSQIKQLSLKNTVEVTDITFYPGMPVGDVSVASLGFSVKGIKENVYNFLTDLGKTAPLSGVGSMNFSDYISDGGEMQMITSVDVYYSPLPKVLPDVQTVINPLSPDEETVYEKLSRLEVLSRSDFKADTPNSNLDDPFAPAVTDF